MQILGKFGFVIPFTSFSLFLLSLPCSFPQFLALTEEDLNKYDLTQGAKKKLKTQLELQK